MSRLIQFVIVALLAAGCGDVDGGGAVMRSWTVEAGEALEVEITSGTMYQVRQVTSSGAEQEIDCEVDAEGWLCCSGAQGVPGPAVVLVVEPRW